jgi:hypothetical protein
MVVNQILIYIGFHGRFFDGLLNKIIDQEYLINVY